jgi:prevent-host-death family protein
MPTVTATEYSKKVGLYQNVAQREAVVITSHGREETVLISADEYRRLKRRDRQVIRVEDMTESDISAIAQAEVPPEYEYLDALLDQPDA